MTPSLWNRSFVIWLIATVQSQFGTALAGIALSFLVLHQTGSASQMALTLAFSLLPNLLMPLDGALVDRWPLKWPLIGSNVLRGALQLAVGGAALFWGEVPLWAINGAAVLTGLAGLFAGPAGSTAVPALVPAGELARANGLLGGLGRGAWLLGTLAGAWIVTRWGPPLAIVVDGLSFFVMAALLGWVKLPARKTPDADAPPSHLLTEVRDGLRVMARSRVLILAPIIALLLNASLAPVTAILPKLFETLGGQATGYGSFLALESLGLMGAGLLVVAWGERRSPQGLIAAGLGLTACAYAVIWAWPQPDVLLGTALVLGLGFGLINTPFQTTGSWSVPGTGLQRAGDGVERRNAFEPAAGVAHAGPTAAATVVRRGGISPGPGRGGVALGSPHRGTHAYGEDRCGGILNAGASAPWEHRGPSVSHECLFLREPSPDLKHAMSYRSLLPFL